MCDAADMSGHTYIHTHTHTHTHRTNTVILAAHARRGLTIPIFRQYMSVWERVHFYTITNFFTLCVISGSSVDFGGKPLSYVYVSLVHYLTPGARVTLICLTPGACCSSSSTCGSLFHYVTPTTTQYNYCTRITLT